jgi:hypothetical protein
MILVLAGLAIAVTPVDPGPALIGGGHLPSASDREWVVSRPGRGLHAGPVAAASRIPNRWRPFAACVLHRESGATLDRPQSGAGALNPSSSAAGRWQMLRPWQRGGSYMARDRLVRFGMPSHVAREVRVWLGGHPIDQWPGVLQDTVAIESLERGGWRHWANGDRCDGLVP